MRSILWALIAGFFLACPAWAVIWQQPQRLSDDPHFSGYPDIVSYGNTLVVVWHDTRHGESELYVNRSTNGGSSWVGESRLTDTPGDSTFPQIAVTNDGTMHVVYQDNTPEPRKQQFDIYYLRSTDRGATWEEPVPIALNPGRSIHPSIAASGDRVHVAWSDISGGKFDIYYRHSPDNGETWESVQQLTSKPDSQDPDTNLPQHPPSLKPRFALSGDTVALTWYDCRHDREPLRRPYPDNWEIYLRVSEDGGTSWKNEVRVTDLAGESTHPDVLLTNSDDWLIAWSDDHNNSQTDLYVASSADREPTQLFAAEHPSLSPRLVRRGSSIGLFWYDNRGDDIHWQVWYAESDDGGASWSAPAAVTDSPRFAGYPEAEANSTSYFLVYQDDRESRDTLRENNFEIYFTRGQ